MKMQNRHNEIDKAPLIEAIENHPSFWNEAFLERIKALLVRRAPALIEKFIEPGYEPDDCIVRVCPECGKFGPDDVKIPAHHLETILGLNAGDIETLQELDIIAEDILTTQSGPWLTLQDVLILLYGHVPQYTEEVEEQCALCYEIEFSDGCNAIWDAPISHFRRVNSALGNLNEFNIGQLLKYPQSRIPCDKAEYLLGLRYLDLKILAEAGIIPYDLVEADDGTILDFAVSDLLQFLDNDDFYEISEEIVEFIDSGDWRADLDLDELTNP